MGFSRGSRSYHGQERTVKEGLRGEDAVTMNLSPARPAKALDKE
jgi:hypothetical protein